MIIGLSGYARSGKDTVADMLPGFTKVAFADPLRALAYDLDPTVLVRETDYDSYQALVDDRGYDWVKDNTNARDFLVALGKGMRKHIHPDIWVTLALTKVAALVDAGRNVVITDVRYPNEAQRIKELGGQVWRIVRPGVEAANEEELRTIQEIDDTGVDWYVQNEGELEELRSVVENLLGLK